jgi:hypothetical protein
MNAMNPPMAIVVGMRVRLRKPHPCGSNLWTVTRTGADVGLACAGCGRRVLLEREEFERRVKEVMDIPAEASPSEGPG